MSAGAGWLVRIEDWALAGWVALVAPALVRVQARSSGLFDPGRPLDGVLGIVALFGVLTCLASRTSGPAVGRGLLGTASVGPFVGGLLLVVASTATALGLSTSVVLLLGAVMAGGAVLIRFRFSPPSVLVRRALVAPYVLVAGGLFWALIETVTADGDLTAEIRQAAASDIVGVLAIVGVLVACSAIYYAMLVYAPRQIAEREGGPIAWLVRYGLFVASVALGAGWLLILAG